MTNRRKFLAGTVVPVLLGSRVAAQTTASPHTFGIRGDQFLLDGRPFVIRSGEMHYPRVPREYWRDRMKKMRALGLNTLCTYVFWNLHEPRPGRFDFSGNLDLAAYIRTAQEEGLWVLLRPGPYICSEWDFGGLPAWLLADPDLHVRTTDPKFLSPVARYLQRVGQEAASLEIARGGPILAVQVENEYGSFGSDREYKQAIRKMIQEAGFSGMLYTSDGSEPKNLAGGTLDGVLAVINFGDTAKVEREFANLDRFRSTGPRMNGEFWCGWFDHWGEKHHTSRPEQTAAGVEWMLSRSISFNLYMVHGGTSWGYMSGANGGEQYEPDTSAYDYDAPLDEAGRPTAKFQAIREVIRKHLPPGETPPGLPPSSPVTASIPRFELKESASVTALLPEPHAAEHPVPMEPLGQSYGFILYRTTLAQAAKGTLEIEEARDFAVVLADGKTIGTLDRRRKQTRIEVDVPAGTVLDILVENMGRINFGPALVSDRKGLVGRVRLNDRALTGWQIFPLPLDNVARYPFGTKSAPGPQLHRAIFHVEKTADTFLDLRGWGKGVVFVNGRNAGRYWKIGPQQTLFVPSTWLRSGDNEVIVLDLLEGGRRSLAGLKDPVYETPA